MEAEIAYLLNSDPSKIAAVNNISDVDPIPTDTQVIVPVNCSCSSSGKYYQHNSYYIMKTNDENYFTISNNTYQGLTTCQSMIDQNIYDSRHLEVGMRLTVPLRCACPSRSQLNGGVRYLLSYLITWGGRRPREEVPSRRAGDARGQSVVPRRPHLSVHAVVGPTRDEVFVPPPPSAADSAPPPVVTAVPTHRGMSNKKWVVVGIGVCTAGLGVVVLIGLRFLLLRRRQRQGGRVVHEEVTFNDSVAPAEAADTMFSEEIRDAIGTLTMYKYEDLERARGNFDEEHRIKGSVFKGVINGDHGAIKRTKGDVLNEIGVLKNINHSSVIRLSGVCVHEGIARSAADEDEGLKVTRRLVGTQGYMAPEYIEYGLITPKMDVFAYGVVLLDLLSGREAAAMTPVTMDGEKEEFLMLWESMEEGFLEGEDMREKIEGFIDPCLESDYPFELAFGLVQLEMRCVARNPGPRLSMREVFVSISTINSSSMDWDPSWETSKFR
ncbi:Protein LYK5 [Acorus calamus]|uniref:Protein LYK5 n=1 Tax=Acorus calamus TaxID=4465 RepID=A0AAV9EKT8_ACOCL|nr:Protein LYK5 [Acorus calamus]